MHIPKSGRVVLANAGVPRAFADAPGGGEVALLDILIEDGRIAALAPPGSIAGEAVQMDRGMVWPCFVDLHTHLDKGQIWPRASNPDGTRMGALSTVGADRAANWNAEDLRARMDFILRCAYAHGTRAIRTHIDSIGPQPWISWPVFCEMRERWRGRIDLQAVALFHPEAAADDAWLGRLADLVAESGGILGGVPYMEAGLDDYLGRVFGHAERRGLNLDFHVDELMDPQAATLRRIAEIALERKFAGRIVAGHCCSIALQAPDDVARTLDLVKRTISMAKDHMVRPSYPGIVICLGGDMITGAIHEELAVTNWGTVQEQFLQVQEQLISAIEAMADAFGRVFLPCVVGNHGRNTLKSHFKDRAFQNYEWNLYHQLRRHFARDKRIQFLIPDETDAYFTVLGHRFLLTHGDVLGGKGGDGIIGAIGPIARGTFKVGRSCYREWLHDRLQRVCPPRAAGALQPAQPSAVVRPPGPRYHCPVADIPGRQAPVE